MERAHASRMQAKREADLEGRMRKDRDVRADRDMRDLKTRRMSEEDRSIEAKKEQARLSKHVVSKSPERRKCKFIHHGLV